MKEIILASGSPRRKELLEQIGLEFKVIVSGIEENIEFTGDPEKYAQQLALMKAQDISKTTSLESLVIGADTIVFFENILGKPKDKSDAYSILKTLSGNVHKVITGLALINSGQNKIMVSSETTEVTFRELGDNEIWSYINSGEPMDKAGAYGIQGLGAVFVEKINGCYSNVVGLPISRLYNMLLSFGVKIL